MLNMVLLPQPDGPTTETNSPGPISRSVDASAWVSPKLWETDLSESLGSAMLSSSVYDDDHKVMQRSRPNQTRSSTLTAMPSRAANGSIAQAPHIGVAFPASMKLCR